MYFSINTAVQLIKIRSRKGTIWHKGWFWIKCS